ncbi:MAG: hypothetical protein D6E12_09380 [Desulfovibrio sp.]|nr:MAG: hypothetical protein D6E12_09380 [Desulfovibrio sp.]
MKGYFYLLCVLYVLHTGVNIFVAVVEPHGMYVMKALIDAVCFALCLVGSYGLAHRKPIWTTWTWRTIYQATLVMGGFFFIAQGFGDVLGIDHPAADAGPINLAMLLIKYLLFAIPVVIYEYAMRTGKWPGEEDKDNVNE